MITQLKNSKLGYISCIMALPLLFSLLCAFGLKPYQSTLAKLPFAPKSITVAVDAGHGGIFNGFEGVNGIPEKDLNLTIAKKIQQLGNQYQVNVILTRDKDGTVGNANSLKEDLANRVAIAQANHADLFVSIHINADLDNPGHNGFEIYLSSQNPYYSQSQILGSAISEEINELYPIAKDLKTRDHGIALLNAPKMPSITIECGYMTNKKDLIFISDAQNQDQIARKILEGIVKYKSSGMADNDHSVNREPILPPMVDMDTSTKKKPNGPILTKVEVEAEYPGGQHGWTHFLNSNFKYPEEAIAKKIQGTVVVQFIVSADGSLSDIRIIKSPHKLLSDETLRIIKKSGKWVPATQNGKM